MFFIIFDYGKNLKFKKMEIADENDIDFPRKSDKFDDIDPKINLSDSPLMENSQQLSKRNINNYIHNNFKDFQRFDFLSFPRKRNFEELTEKIHEDFFLEEEKIHLDFKQNKAELHSNRKIYKFS